VRPDVLPQPALVELSKMQDGVEGFEQSIAIAMVEQELGRPLMEVFSEFADEPVAAASLAQVNPTPAPAPNPNPDPNPNPNTPPLLLPLPLPPTPTPNPDPTPTPNPNPNPHSRRSTVQCCARAARWWPSRCSGRTAIQP